MSVWIPVDRRLHEHPKIRRIARELSMDRYAVVGCMVYLWGLVEDLGASLGPDPSDEEHGLPAGFLAQVEKVGWATREKGDLVLTSRKSDRSAIARRAAAARWASGMHDASSMHADASSMHAHASDASHAIDRERDRKRKRSDASNASRRARPPAPNGADRPASEVVIRDPPGTVYLSPAEALAALKREQERQRGQLAIQGQAG